MDGKVGERGDWTNHCDASDDGHDDAGDSSDDGLDGSGDGADNRSLGEVRE